MSELSVFISYSHEDEWLKDELIQHLSGLKRNGIIDIWHDRLIPAGKLLDDEIDARVASSDIFLPLISPAFLSSEYCYSREYKSALDRHDLGDAEIIPVIVRDCDWDVDRLRSFNALPRDGAPVTRHANSRSNCQERDVAWLNVVNGLKYAISELKKRNAPPKLIAKYLDQLFKVDFIRHPQLQRFDDDLVFVDPDVFHENEKITIHSFDAFCGVVNESGAAVITGGDRSGKTLLAKKLQARLTERAHPFILINGDKIRNSNISDIIDAELTAQFGHTEYPRKRFGVIIDDFDECQLNDRIKESMIRHIYASYRMVVFFSFSSAPSVLLAPDDLPDPAVFKLEPLADEKIFAIVKKWRSIGIDHIGFVDERDVLRTYEKLQVILQQTELERSPYTAITFLELLESASGEDLAFSSFASCYEALISSRLSNHGIGWQSFDEAKNFLSYVAYRAHSDNGTPWLSQASFDECIDAFQQKFLSASGDLQKMSIGPFLRQEGPSVRFCEEYLWFFLCARYVAKYLRRENPEGYNDFIQTCANNVFQKKYANIVIYIAYFTEDDIVLSCLMEILDGLFSKADSFVLSDDCRELMLGLAPQDHMAIESRSDVSDNAVDLLRDRVPDILRNAERVVAMYTLPFLNSEIADSAYVEGIEKDEIDAESYLRSVNALLRIHSVVGQIMAGRTGTFSARLVMDCITRMVEASGRYASLNHAIATILIFERDKSLKEIDQVIQGDLTPEEKYQKVMRIFSFWSVYLAQAGLARYLSQAHSIRALERLAREYESGDLVTERGNIPFNFTSVMIIARLYHTGAINRREIESCIEKYGSESALMSLLRATMHIYAYYMPMSIRDKQWISEKLGMPLRRIEMQRVRASRSKSLADTRG